MQQFCKLKNWVQALVSALEVSDMLNNTKCDMQRDYRFDLETQWNDYVVPILREQPWIIPATIVTIDDGIIGWKLHGWIPPSGEIIYEIERVGGEG